MTVRNPTAASVDPRADARARQLCAEMRGDDVYDQLDPIVQRRYLELAYPLVVRRIVKTPIRTELHGRACRIVIHPGGRSGSRLIELDNGDRVVTLGAYLRRAIDPKGPTP